MSICYVCSGQNHILYLSSDIWEMGFKIQTQHRYVTRVGEVRNAHKILVEKTERKRAGRGWVWGWFKPKWEETYILKTDNFKNENVD